MVRKRQNSRKTTGLNVARRGEPHQASREVSRTRCEIFRPPVILVLERDPLLRWALYETLVEAGFLVLTAPEGRSAALLDQLDQAIALAIVDDEGARVTRPASS